LCLRDTEPLARRDLRRKAPCMLVMQLNSKTLKAKVSAASTSYEPCLKCSVAQNSSETRRHKGSHRR
jgi:hypothetical protein